MSKNNPPGFDAMMAQPMGQVINAYAHDDKAPEHFEITCGCQCGDDAVLVLAKGIMAEQLLNFLRQHTPPYRLHG